MSWSIQFLYLTLLESGNVSWSSLRGPTIGGWLVRNCAWGLLICLAACWETNRELEVWKQNLIIQLLPRNGQPFWRNVYKHKWKENINNVCIYKEKVNLIKRSTFNKGIKGKKRPPLLGWPTILGVQDEPSEFSNLQLLHFECSEQNWLQSRRRSGWLHP